MRIVVRGYAHAHDAGFVFSTWPKGAYYAAADKIHKSKRVWFNEMYDYVQLALETGRVLIACHDDTPNVIVGYAVQLDDTLEWVYVKEDYRKQGIATMLYNALGRPTTCRRGTAVGVAIATHLGLKETK